MYEVWIHLAQIEGIINNDEKLKDDKFMNAAFIYSFNVIKRFEEFRLEHIGRYWKEPLSEEVVGFINACLQFMTLSSFHMQPAFPAGPVLSQVFGKHGAHAATSTHSRPTTSSTPVPHL